MSEQEQTKKPAVIQIKNHRKGDLVLGARFVKDPVAGDYERAAESVAHGQMSKPMTPADFKFYDVPAVAEMVAKDELEIFVNGVSKRRTQPAPAPKPQTTAQALSAPTESAESAESRELAALLGGEVK